MESYLKGKIWSFQYHLSKVQSALIENGMTDTERRIREHVEALRYFSLLCDLPGITAVTGAQGVGKSYHISQMCEIPENQRLLSSLGRAEKIPVFLMSRTNGAPCDVRVYKRTAPTETGSFLFEDMTFETARERVAKPETDDLCMFWYVDGNAFLESLAPIAVLPGFEYKTPWEMAIKIVLDLSESVIYVVDQSRLAQQVSKTIEDKIDDLKLTTPAVVLISKVDNMPDTKIAELASNVSYRTVPVGIVEHQVTSLLSKERLIGTQEQYNEILMCIGEHITASGSERKLELLETSVGKSIMYLEDAWAEIDQLETRKSAVVLRSINAFLGEQDEMWNRLVRPTIIDHARTVCIGAAEKAHEDISSIVQKEFKKKVKIWFNGGVKLDFVNDLQKGIASSFITNVKPLNGEISSKLGKTTESLTRLLSEPSTGAYDVMIQTGRELILIDTLSTPLGRIDDKINSDLSKIMEGASGAMKSVGNTVEKAQDLSKNIQPVVEAISKKKGKEEIFKEIQKLPDKRRAQALQGLVTGAIGAKGAALAGAEIAGAGFAGATMSIVAGVLGAAVAGLAIGSWLMSVTRTANKTEFMVDDLARRCAQAMSNQMQADLSEKLDRFWDCFQYRMKLTLLSDTGIDQHDKSIIILAQATNSALKDGKEVVKTLGLAYAP